MARKQELEKAAQDLEQSPDDAVSMEEIQGEVVSSLPNKEVMSLLDVNADVDLGLDLTAPVDLAVAANLNVAAPIEAAVAANVLSPDAEAVAVAQQTGSITQGITGDAGATAEQDATVTQAADDGTTDATLESPSTGDGTLETSTTGELGGTLDGATGELGDTIDDTTGELGDTIDGATGSVDSYLQGGNLLNADVNIDADADVAAPVNGAVAANANIAAPINAAAAANIGSEGAIAQSVAVQDVDISQSIEGDATANADQDADVSQ